MSRLDVAIAIVNHRGQLLICQRLQSDSFGGYWEFPGGKCEPDESPGQCAIRELREEAGIEARVVTSLPVIEHDYPTIRIRLHPFICSCEQADARPIECQQVRWVAPSELPSYTFPPANARLIEQLKG